MKLRKFFLAASASALPWAAAAEPDASSIIINAGPLKFGDDIEAVMAALPGADWKIEFKYEFSGRPMRVAAADAFEFGGQRVAVEVRQGYYDWHIELKAKAMTSSVRDCERQGVVWLKAVEAGAGAFASDDPFGPGDNVGEPAWAVVQSPDGEYSIEPIKGAKAAKGAREEWISLGEGSLARFNASTNSGAVFARRNLATKSPDRFSINAKRSGDHYEVRAHASIGAFDSGTCNFEAIYLGWKDLPPTETVAFNPSNIVRVMSVGDRHRLLKPLSLPSSGVVIPEKCRVSRQTGKVLMCHGPQSMSDNDAVENAAGRIAAATVFTMTGIDRDDPQEVSIEIPVHLDPSDIRPEGFAANPRISMSDVSFIKTPPAKEVEYAYPVRAMQKGVRASVSARCEIQTDGSLICLSPLVEQSDGLGDLTSDFSRGVEKLAPMYRSAPQLKNGKPSAGAVFDFAVKFEIHE